MNVVRLACSGPTEILAVLVSENHSPGDLEGLAHWDGVRWRWIEKRVAWTLALDRFFDQWVALDFAGELTFRTNTNVLEKTASGTNGMNDMYIRGSEVFVVGLAGAFQRFASGGWSNIDHQYANNIYAINGTTELIHACGASGLVLSYDGSQCRDIILNSQFDLTSICSTPSGDTFVTGGNGEEGALIHVRSGRVHSTLTRLQFLRAADSDSLLAIDLDGTVWHWDGRETRRVRVKEHFQAFCFNRQDGVVAIGGQDCIAIGSGEKFDVVSVLLDPAFLEQ